MSLKRASKQADETLAMFYSRMIIPGNSDFKIGTGMLAFVNMANETFLKTELFGLTLRDQLILHAEDDLESGWCVIVTCSGEGEYDFEFPMPEDQSPPWKYATVKGMATDLVEARNYLIIAMIQSRGWKGSEELKALFKAL